MKEKLQCKKSDKNILLPLFFPPIYFNRSMKNKENNGRRRSIEKQSFVLSMVLYACV